MNSASGIGASQELVDTFASAVASGDVRIIKVSIKNESLVPDGVAPRSGSLQSDLKQLAGLVSTDPDLPAYYLVRLDSSASEWLAISYVPDTAKVRDKMLYASTRNALTKALGSDRFTDAMFATNQNELTPEGYAAHLRHSSAPQPLSAREAEMANIRAAEKAAGLDAYKGAGERKSHVGAVGLSWTGEVEAALKDLAEESPQNTLVLLSIDQEKETLVLRGVSHPTPNDVGGSLPNSEPSYAFYSWPRNGLVFIYACPSSSNIRHRMLYSAGVQSFIHNVKGLGVQVTKKAETSDPGEVNEAWLKTELAAGSSGANTPTADRGFAKPRGPTRKR